MDRILTDNFFLGQQSLVRLSYKYHAGFQTDVPSGSCSLDNNFKNYPVENGRTYHKYHEGCTCIGSKLLLHALLIDIAYILPNDQLELDRQELQYEILRTANGGKIFLAPLNNPKRILDIGTGSGQWAIEMGKLKFCIVLWKCLLTIIILNLAADIFPNAELTGTDLSPIQPNCVPVNVHFYIDDATESDWLWPENHFDHIHTAMLLGSHISIETLICTAFKYVKPGGYVECHDYDVTLRCDDGTLPPSDPNANSPYAFQNWVQLLTASADRLDRSITFASRMSAWMREAGFVDVEEKVTKIPINPWPRDEKFKQIGAWNEQNWLEGLQAFSYALLGARGLGWTQEQIEVYLIDVRKSVSDRRVHAYNHFHTVVGRKPESTQ